MAQAVNVLGALQILLIVTSFLQFRYLSKLITIIHCFIFLLKKKTFFFVGLDLPVRRIGEEQEVIESYRATLKKYSLQGARDYLKLMRRLDKEERNQEFLLQKMVDTDNDLVQVCMGCTQDTA